MPLLPTTPSITRAQDLHMASTPSGSNTISARTRRSTAGSSLISGGKVTSGTTICTIICWRMLTLKRTLCWFFTDQWRQGDFGDYYLYDNLLEDVDFEENSLLPLALLGGKGSDALLPLALLSGDDNDDLLPLALLSG